MSSVLDKYHVEIVIFVVDIWCTDKQSPTFVVPPIQGLKNVG